MIDPHFCDFYYPISDQIPRLQSTELEEAGVKRASKSEAAGCHQYKKAWEDQFGEHGELIHGRQFQGTSSLGLGLVKVSIHVTEYRTRTDYGSKCNMK
jgi:hypothetical protein